MVSNNFSKELSPEQNALSLRVLDLLISRVLKNQYSTFNEDTKKLLEEIFESNDDKKKEEFLKTHLPNFKKLMKDESKKLEEEIKLEIKKQI
jgi:hypothetical protein